MSSLAPLALSTMWFQRFGESSSLRPFFDAAHAIGFDRFEIGPVVPPEAMPTIGAERIATVHHPCPRPAEPSPPLTSVDVNARARASASLEETVRLAARLGASAVVVHLGPCPDQDDTLRRLEFEINARFLGGDSGWRPVAAELGERVAEQEASVLRNAVSALERPLRVAADEGVVVAWETGRHPVELPTPRGAALLAESEPRLRGWLDSGHVAVRGRLGFGTFDEWLTQREVQWAGAHLHDARGLRDHLVPGLGDVPFTDICSRLGARAELTCEFDWYYTPEEVRAGAMRLLEWGCGSGSCA